MIRIFVLLILASALFSCSGSVNKSEDGRPNILLLVADDLGYADLGCFGSDISTPNIDELANNGIRFSNFHTGPMCAPTRAMLLSGNDNHIAGMGRQSLVTSEFGYEGCLSDRVAAIPEILQDAGYHTYMAGKWHLGLDSISNPANHGFECSFVNLRGAGNQYNDQGIFEETPIALYTENGHPAKWIKGSYTTDFYTDKIIEYIEANRGDGKPFFVFAAFTSPHWPLQVDEKFWKKYEGRYDEGYEKLKELRLASLKESGMIPEGAVLPPNHPDIKPWDALSDSEQKKEARKMELYAGMVDNLDYNIGRIVAYLKETGSFENSLILFMSDNGAAAEDFFYDPTYGPYIRQNFNDLYENMGAPDSFISYGPQWAEAGSAPFRYFKGHVTEGGVVAPMIISGKGVESGNIVIDRLITVMDIAPTFYELAETSYPTMFQGRELYPLKGKSIINLVTGVSNQHHDEEYVFGLEHGGRSFLRRGNWKLVNDQRPYKTENFELFDLSKDLAELHNLKSIETEVYEELLIEWKKMIDEIKAQFPSPTGLN